MGIVPTSFRVVTLFLAERAIAVLLTAVVIHSSTLPKGKCEIFLDSDQLE